MFRKISFLLLADLLVMIAMATAIGYFLDDVVCVISLPRAVGSAILMASVVLVPAAFVVALVVGKLTGLARFKRYSYLMGVLLLMVFVVVLLVARSQI